MQTSHISRRSLDFSADHYGVVSVLQFPLTCQLEGMMTLQESSQLFGEIGKFGVLTDICEFWINKLCVLVQLLKTLKVCVIATMAPVLRFELIGDEYLDASPDCCEVVVRVGWLGFLQKLSGFNLAISREFAPSFDGIKEQIGDVELRLTKEFVSQAIGLPLAGECWYKGKHVKNDDWK